MRIIGFSTGALSRGDYRQALEMLADKDVNAVELSAAFPSSEASGN